MELTAEKITHAVAGKLLQGSPRSLMQGVATDTRSLNAGELFIALKGNRFDGHGFIAQALKKNASGLLVSRKYDVRELSVAHKDIPIIQVADTLSALGDLARFWRQQNRATVVAITGSNGKTTTREMAATILEQSYDVLKPEQNFNNLIGLPLTLLRLKPHHQIAVVEMGTNQRGEIMRLAQIAEPDIGVITNIGPGHLQQLKTIESVAQEKGKLFEALAPHHWAVVNRDDPLIIDLAKHCRAQQRSFSIKEHAQVSATPISSLLYSVHQFILRVEKKKVTVALASPGIANIYNALAAATIATLFNLDVEEIKSGLESFSTFPGRMEIITIGNNINLINDTYNANPSSMEHALRVLAEMKGSGRAIAVLGDMLELGDSALPSHQQLGALLAELCFEKVFLIGTFAEAVAESARARGMEEGTLSIGKTHAQIAQKLQKTVHDGDWILFKGSRGMKMERIVERVLSLREEASGTFPQADTTTAKCNC